ncbi:MAG: helix-turn-helix domain-containing protein [Candidatus Methanomethylophilaceae archaeon]
MPVKAYRYRINPSKSQISQMEQTLEIRRWVYNEALAMRKNAWEQEQTMTTVSIPAHMSLQEVERTRELLNKAKNISPLTPAEEDELRHYLAKEQPRAQGMSGEKLITFGLFFLGMIGFFLMLKAASDS